MLSMLLLSIYFSVLQKECKIRSNQFKPVFHITCWKFIQLYQSSLEFSVNLNICDKCSKNLNSAFSNYIHFSKYTSRKVTFNQTRTNTLLIQKPFNYERNIGLYGLMLILCGTMCMTNFWLVSTGYSPSRQNMQKTESSQIFTIFLILFDNVIGIKMSLSQIILTKTKKQQHSRSLRHFQTHIFNQFCGQYSYFNPLKNQVTKCFKMVYRRCLTGL